jgi:hypothetical protein
MIKREGKRERLKILGEKDIQNRTERRKEW